MTLSNAILCILFTTLVASYGWGMRGALIGGEKGAMLPGAFIGLVLTHFSGVYAYLAPVAAGLMGMTYGGIEPYGETIGLVLDNPHGHPKRIKGYIGLAFKGALWFSICGGFIAFSFSRKVYSLRDIQIFCVLIPLIQLIGYLIFNTPYNKEKGIYPKIRFSPTRREEWGSNLLLLIAMMAMAVIRNDSFALLMMTFGFFFGAIGWAVAIKCFDITIFPMKNGKYLFGKLFTNHLIDGWKFMEFVLGAFGGFGLSLAFCIGFDYIEEYNSEAALNGVKFVDEKLDDIAPIICILCVAAVFIINYLSYICDKKNVNINSFVLDRIERIFYCVIPMVFVLWGQGGSIKIMTAFMLVFVAVIKILFDRFKKVNFVTLIISLAVISVSFVYLVADRVTPMEIIIAGTVPYVLGELVCAVYRQTQKGEPIKTLFTKTSFATVFPAFVVMSAAIIIISAKIF